VRRKEVGELLKCGHDWLGLEEVSCVFFQGKK
jgi:hypothetical protein